MRYGIRLALEWDMVSPLKYRLTLLAWTFYFILFLMPPQALAANLSCRELFSDAKKDFSARPIGSAEISRKIQIYLNGTINSLQYMRGEDGLTRDTMWIQSKGPDDISASAVNTNTSPSNIASDMLVQIELISRNSQNLFAVKNLSKILRTLAKVQRHTPSGLFFSWYSTDASSVVTGPAISSIDNIHLAIALWTVKETFPGTRLAQQAQKILEPMNLSMFYDEPTGLIGGNFKLSNGQWEREAFNYSNLGSETRLLYTAGYALGLFKNYINKSDFLTKAFAALKLEVTKTPEGLLLRLWNGSAFQYFFPAEFSPEEQVSPILQTMSVTMGNYMIGEGQRRHLLTPAAHSPGILGFISEGENKVVPVYNDMAGNKNLVSTDNQDLKDPNLNKIWDSTFAPYAYMMAAAAQPEKLIPILIQLENVKSEGHALYIPEHGWMDGLRVTGPDEGQVVPAQVAINQAMSAIALLRAQAPDHMTASARAIYKNRYVRERFQFAVDLFVQKISEATPK